MTNQPPGDTGTWEMQSLAEVHCKSHFCTWKRELLPSPIRLPSHVLRLTSAFLCSGLIPQGRC